MASNKNSHFKPEHFRVLSGYAEKAYEITVIDTSSLSDELSAAAFMESDYIVMVLAQTRQSMGELLEKSCMVRNSGKKTIAVVNRYISRSDGVRAEYDISAIARDFKSAGFLPAVFELPFSLDLINECNANTLLDLVLSPLNRKNPYVRSINRIAAYLLEQQKSITADLNKKRKGTSLSRALALFR
jgi:MinD-like ATPase involved in chromosome partitioning or flagellar assembly